MPLNLLVNCRAESVGQSISHVYQSSRHVESSEWFSKSDGQLPYLIVSECVSERASV